MSLLKCDKCGEMYSDSYRSCPFCAEDKAFLNGGEKKQKKATRNGRKKTPSIIGPMMVLILVLMAALVVWYFLGDSIKTMLGYEVKDPTPVVSIEDPVTDSNTPAVVLTMDATLLIKPGESTALKVTGGSNYEWISSDPAVVTVNSSGEVIAISGGSAVITVVDSTGASAVCSVTVSLEAEEVVVNPKDTEPDDPKTEGNKPTKVDVSKLKLLVPVYGTELNATNSEKTEFDVQMIKGESFQIEIEGTTASVEWSSSDSNIVTASEDGTLTWKGKGTATVTAKIGDAELKILVRAVS